VVNFSKKKKKKKKVKRAAKFQKLRRVPQRERQAKIIFEAA
jgi:hypothetical protein